MVIPGILIIMRDTKDNHEGGIIAELITIAVMITFREHLFAHTIGSYPFVMKVHVRFTMMHILI